MTWTDLSLVLIAALLLALERACYLSVWREPARFRQIIVDRIGPAAEPVGALANLFVLFKVVQAAVFLGWCLYFGGGRLLPADAPLPVLAAGTMLIVVGQVLNAAVFVRLGLTGVFYGNRFGHAVHWRYGFPFSWLRHPQYVGTVATIWGVFLALRFPNPDWIVLPLLETAYYVAGAFLEDDATPPASLA
ncbi:MAG: PEMT/PEM2 methyltransferase family protein [Vicinamibacteraceae bacterium]